MGAFLSGCLGFFAIMFALVFFIQYPPVFWVVLTVLAVVIILGLRKGFKQSSGPSKVYPPVPDNDDDFEGDIRHHYYQGGGTKRDAAENPGDRTLSQSSPDEDKVYENDIDDEGDWR